MFGGAELEQRAAAYRVVDAHHRAGGAATGGDFFHGQGIGDVIDVAAAPFFRHHHAQQAQFAHLPHHGVIDPAGLVPLGGPGRQLALGELAGHIADHALVFVEFDIVHLLCLPQA